MSTATIALQTEQPLTSEHYAELARADERAKKIRKAARVASMNGWMSGICAACSLPFAMFSVEGFIIAAALCAITYFEFRGRRGMLQFEPESAVILARNQIGLLLLIVVYSLWKISGALTGEGPLTAELAAKPELAALIGSTEGIDELYKAGTMAFYGLVIGLSAIFQGGNAFYYYSRRKYIENCIESTPPWALKLQQMRS